MRFVFCFIQQLINWDKRAFLTVNTKWVFAWLDMVAPILRNAITWVPLYVFLFFFVVINFRKKSILWIVFFLLTIAFSDQMSSNLFKNIVVRTRPCQDQTISNLEILRIDGCPANYSFPSSHASNHFAMATFIFFTLYPFFKKFSYLFFIWAFAISYAQIYVGVHYPLDVIIGSLLGLSIGGYMSYFYLHHFKKLRLS
ncbi:MAG: phosphatase PAP2 family protein [Phycisphaerales bacterium]|nr:phosphatase PAP2 family protein [Phycisphaerales bacterium]